MDVKNLGREKIPQCHFLVAYPKLQTLLNLFKKLRRYFNFPKNTFFSLGLDNLKTSVDIQNAFVITFIWDSLYKNYIIERKKLK